MKILIIALMTVITMFVCFFYKRLATLGSDESFHVVGRWTPSIVGMTFSIALSILLLVNEMPMLLPVTLFIFSLIWLYVNMSPIIIVNGEDAVCVTFKGRKPMNKDKMDFVFTPTQIIFNVEKQPVSVYKDSINYDKFRNWLGL